MNFDIKLIAARKKIEHGQGETEWLKALESARLSLKFIEIDYQSLETFAVASSSPEQFTTLTRLIYQYGKSHPNGDQISDLVLSMVNASPFSLTDWISATEQFHTWLLHNGRKVDFLLMLKYLECCVASKDAQESGQTLSALILDMLQVQDYEG